MKPGGGKTQKKAEDGRILPSRQFKDIKAEVGEDTKLLLSAALSSGREKNRTIKQTSLLGVEKPSEKPSRVDVSESEIINVKRMPDLDALIEVRDFNELRKVGRAFKFINCFEDDKQRVYFVGGYFLRECR